MASMLAFARFYLLSFIRKRALQNIYASAKPDRCTPMNSTRQRPPRMVPYSCVPTYCLQPKVFNADTKRTQFKLKF